MGLTAGKGKDGAGDADRRMDGDEPKEERRLWDTGGEIHLEKLAVGGQRKLSVFGLETVNVHGTIGRLGGDEFIQRIPGNALNIV
jgi:hypothetical protein